MFHFQKTFLEMSYYHYRKKGFVSKIAKICVFIARSDKIRCYLNLNHNSFKIQILPQFPLKLLTKFHVLFFQPNKIFHFPLSLRKL